ncbi:hypothetical protein LXH13_38660 [Streptomyces spinosirectus]|jgi:hypothetical protein|uniref:hypothetical protein n=1 Tax=Streptomyces TaxID=1883 RepID=UPI001C9DCE26|nr:MULTISPECIES: hypothetical protein [Streptomyces]MBY8343392.1 hypothetical protein [Streptomyces plumbidurans]UIR22610.1 hypothetical protein LXH13_38660 [Streptomyces spinosirectus]
MRATDAELVNALTEQLGDEKIVAAAYARVNTVLSPARMLSPLGNYLIARPAARAAAKKMTEETDIPLDAAVVFGLSDSALHVWAADPMLNRVGQHLGQMPLERIASIKVENGKNWQPFTITMADGKSVELEGRGPIHALAAAFDKHKAQ